MCCSLLLEFNIVKKNMLVGGFLLTSIVGRKTSHEQRAIGSGNPEVVPD
jgi:hypothetical protein